MKISITVRANSGKDEVSVAENGSVIVRTKEAPRENKANVRVIRLLAKHFRIAPSCISIIRGTRSKNKLIQIIK